MAQSVVLAEAMPPIYWEDIIINKISSNPEILKGSKKEDAFMIE